MSKDSKTLEVLKEMAQLTALSGRICEVQEYNLKVFPFCFLDGVEEVAINYDLTTNKSIEDEPTKNASSITYNLSINKLVVNSDMDKRLEAIEKSVRNLLWNDVRVEVFVNGKIQFVSKQ